MTKFGWASTVVGLSLAACVGPLASDDTDDEMSASDNAAATTADGGTGSDAATTTPPPPAPTCTCGGAATDVTGSGTAAKGIASVYGPNTDVCGSPDVVAKCTDMISAAEADAVAKCAADVNAKMAAISCSGSCAGGGTCKKTTIPPICMVENSPDGCGTRLVAGTEGTSTAWKCVIYSPAVTATGDGSVKCNCPNPPPADAGADAADASSKG